MTRNVLLILILAATLLVYLDGTDSLKRKRKKEDPDEDSDILKRKRMEEEREKRKRMQEERDGDGGCFSVKRKRIQEDRKRGFFWGRKSMGPVCRMYDIVAAEDEAGPSNTSNSPTITKERYMEVRKKLMDLGTKDDCFFLQTLEETGKKNCQSAFESFLEIPKELRSWCKEASHAECHKWNLAYNGYTCCSFYVKTSKRNSQPMEGQWQAAAVCGQGLKLNPNLPDDSISSELRLMDLG